MDLKKPTLTEEKARAVLAEFPDADLSAFEIVAADGAVLDENRLAEEEGARVLDVIASRMPR